jgi:SAM-dependent methyltransferase
MTDVTNVSPSTNHESTNKQKHSSGNPFMAIALNRFHETVRSLFPPTVRTVLEAGCGEGFSAQAILSDKQQLKSFGGDLSYPALIEARTRFAPMRYSVVDAMQMPFADNSVDLVFSLEVLEHLPDPGAALQEYIRISNRYLLVSVPNDPIFRALRLASGKGLNMWGDHPEHIQHWIFPTFQHFLKQNGLTIRKAVLPFPFVWSVILCEK